MMLGNTGRMVRWLPYALAGVLVLPPNVSAQTPTITPPGLSAQPATVQSLKVIPLTRNQDMNDLERKVMAPLVVQVVDHNDQPVEGADVIFRFPLDGPSATFANQKDARTFRTNVDGQAAATGWMANSKVGTFQVQVTASRGNELGSAIVSMTNVTRIAGAGPGRSKSRWSSKWTKIGIAVGAAAVTVAIVLATRNSGPKSPIVVTGTPGSPTIGGPQ
jgi:hypothetical protein